MGELDTEVKGDPETLTVTAQWMRERCVSLEDLARAFASARGESETGWLGLAGDNLRALLTEGDKMANGQTMLITSMVTALETHQADLRTVRARMQQARDVAREGGLVIEGFKIKEPGPAPAAPGQLPKNATPQQKEQHAGLTEANADYVKQVRAYKEASQIVKATKDKETNSQSMVVQFLSGTFDPAKFTVTLGDISGGTAAAIAARTSAWRTIASNVKSPALASKMAANPSISAAGQLKAASIAAERTMDHKYALNMAQATRASRFIDKYVPPRVTRMLDAKIVPKSVTPPANIFVRGGSKVLSKLPWVGLGFTAVGVGLDVSGGKDPTQAVVSNTAGFAVGGLIGASIGGPVGAVAGGLIGVGVGFVVDEVWEAAG